MVSRKTPTVRKLGVAVFGQACVRNGGGGDDGISGMPVTLEVPSPAQLLCPAPRPPAQESKSRSVRHRASSLLEKWSTVTKPKSKLNGGPPEDMDMYRSHNLQLSPRLRSLQAHGLEHHSHDTVEPLPAHPCYVIPPDNTFRKCWDLAQVRPWARAGAGVRAGQGSL